MSECHIEGFDSVLNLFDEINDIEVKKALNLIGDTAVNKMQGAIKEDTGSSKRSIKKTVRKVNSGIKLTVKINNDYYKNQEYGSSRSNPSNVSKIYRAVKGIDSEALEILKKLVIK